MSRTLLLAAAVAALPFLAACQGVGDAPTAEVTEAPATPAQPAADAGAFAGTALPVTPDNSTIAWKAAKVSLAHDGGFRAFEGNVYVDGDRLTGVDVAIDATSIWSDSDRLTEHLKSPDFFDVATYPEARFRADTFEPATDADRAAVAAATHRVSGELTMHGQTNRITFPAVVALSPDSVSVDADFLIDRNDWGIVYEGMPDDLIDEEVRILLDVNVPRVAAPQASLPAEPVAAEG